MSCSGWYAVANLHWSIWNSRLKRLKWRKRLDCKWGHRPGDSEYCRSGLGIPVPLVRGHSEQSSIAWAATMISGHLSCHLSSLHIYFVKCHTMAMGVKHLIIGTTGGAHSISEIQPHPIQPIHQYIHPLKAFEHFSCIYRSIWVFKLFGDLWYY